MGVTGLWTVVQPCARPIKIETLNKKRLAVDASIWIYQFLKAVRDKEGNALRNSHVVGFFRRICKLLFFGIKPVFVFDGGAPALKRQTISNRKRRREGRREDAVRTAGKLLAVQMQRKAEEEAERRKHQPSRTEQDEHEEDVPANPVYVDELQMTPEQRRQNRKFKKKDAYHLPDLDVSLSDMGAPNDPRVMSQEELEEYAQHFNSGEDINLYDFSKIDFNSAFFLSLPASDRYNILNAARLRSRLRMGYSKEQLDNMFPDRMAFSRFQIERVTERNELTQRLMNINGMNGEDAMFNSGGPGRVAGEKGKEYVLVKNDGVEGGWALGVVSNRDEGKREKPIDIDEVAKSAESEAGEELEDDEGGFEDVPIEGLNRLPRHAGEMAGKGTSSGYVESLGHVDALERRRRFYESRQREAGLDNQASEEPNSLFVEDDVDDKPDDVAERQYDNLFNQEHESASGDEREDLDRAIAMSLEQDNEGQSVGIEGESSTTYRAGETSWRIFDGQNPGPHADESDDDDMDLQAALAQSRKTRRRLSPQPGSRNPQVRIANQTHGERSVSTENRGQNGGFSGPLPFEKLDFGKSLLGAKKSKANVDNEGGFEKDYGERKEVKTKPLPPWFSSDIEKDSDTQKAMEGRQDHDYKEMQRSDASPAKILKTKETNEVINVDAASEADDDVEMIEAPSVDQEIRMGDVADLARAEPPSGLEEVVAPSASPISSEARSSAAEHSRSRPTPKRSTPEGIEPSKMDHPAGGDLQPQVSKSPSPVFENVAISDQAPSQSPRSTALEEGVGTSRSPSPEFEDVVAADSQAPGPPPDNNAEQGTSPSPIQDAFENAPVTAGDDEDETYSDAEDDELLRQLAVEAEEHARFASELNNKSQLQNQEDYERELRGLRAQQKKDRRDADEVSHIMVTECQQLLKLFGLPYITAPMEAEAQCAELVSLGLVDGIVTDDSDIFLFGGTRVYKNMFNQAKFVECYLASDLEKEFDLDREKLIRIAHLLGSDYTEGIPSVGPVTALEIVSEFNSPNGLDDFKDWWQNVQIGKKTPEDTDSPFRKKFVLCKRRAAARLLLPSSFPSPAVSQAYHHPDVDSDPQPFFWGTADLDALRSFLMATIGWTQERTDEVLVPVIRDMNRRENEGTQSNITGFFSGSAGTGTYAPRKRKEAAPSGRMSNALGKLKAGAKRKRGLAPSE
ncbi:MAG: hypothetical protein M4579_005741 [Chaenotheca gracillima]|nr:MAG: hypothetical protein M4579_005741 [Chaenotheca gracillima]